MLQDSTNIALSEADRTALDVELDSWLKKFRPLVLIAGAGYVDTNNPEYARLTQTYTSYITRFEEARAKVASGLSIDSVRCVGQGKALTGKRYQHFRCSATSYVLEIPNIELVPSFDPFLPEVVEGPRRNIGPLSAVFSVHVMGKSRMLSQRSS